MNAPLYIRVLIIGVIGCVAVFSEWVIARMLGGSSFLPSVAMIGVVIILVASPLVAGLLFAMAAGFILDSIALPPFGATLLLFLFLACMTHLLKAVIADRDSYRVRIVLGVAVACLGFLVLPLARIAAGHLHLW